MKKLLYCFIPLVLCSLSAFAGEAGFDQVSISCSAVTVTGACASFNIHPSDFVHIPSVGNFTWQTIISGGTATSVSVTLEGSVDNATWSTLDTSTGTSGETRTISPGAVKFFRCNVGGYSRNGTTLTCQIMPTQATASGTINTGAAGRPAVYTSGSAIGSSGRLLDASTFAGATVDVKVNACITAAIASGTTCDARALGGSQTIAAQINVGDVGGDQVTLLLPSVGIWTANIADGTSCAVKQWGNTSIIGSPGSGLSNGGTTDFSIRVTGGSNLGYIYCNDTTAGNFYYASGFSIYNPTKVTANGVGMYISATFDNSTWEYITVVDSVDTYAVRVDSMCCGVNFNKMRIDGASGAGVTPFFINATVSTLFGHPHAFHITNSTINHPGAGFPALLVSDTSASHFMSLDFTNIYTETNSTDSTTTLYQLSAPRSISFTNVNIQAQQTGADTAAAISLSNTYNSALTVTNLVMNNGTGAFTYPATAIINNFTGQNELTDSQGNLGYYSSTSWGPANFTAASAASQPGLQVTGTPFTGGSGSTTLPHVFINSGGAASNWSTSGTIFGINTPNAFAGNILDLKSNGGATSAATLSGGGSWTISGSQFMATGTRLSFNSDVGISRDLGGVLDVGTGAAGSTSGRVKASGYMSVGTKFTTNNGCGESSGTTTGGATAGKYTTSGQTSCTSIITMGDSATAPNGWDCHAADLTTAADSANPHQTATTTTTATIVSGTIVAADVISFHCVGY